MLAFAVLNACASAPIDRQPHPDFSGTYSFLPVTTYFNHTRQSRSQYTLRFDNDGMLIVECIDDNGARSILENNQFLDVKSVYQKSVR